MVWQELCQLTAFGQEDDGVHFRVEGLANTWAKGDIFEESPSAKRYSGIRRNTASPL